MTGQPIPDPPTVYHAGFTPGGDADLGPDDLESCFGYVVLDVTPTNAARYGYASDETGLKVRLRRQHLAAVADLTEARQAVLQDLSARLCLLAEPRDAGTFYEVMLRDAE